MSADNWTICPKCRAKATAEKNAAQLQAGASYGKVTPEEYLAMLETANKPIDLRETLREDYEIGISNRTGEFYVNYRCSCRCGFSFEFKHRATPALNP